MGQNDESEPSASAVSGAVAVFDRRSILRKGIGFATISGALGGIVGEGAAKGVSENFQQGEGEPNDAQIQARFIEPGRVNGQIGPCCIPGVGDEDDWFKFDVVNGDGILVDFHQPPPARARLIGPDNNVLDVEGHLPSRLTGLVSHSGTAYIHLTDPPGGANNAYSFTLDVNQTGDESSGDSNGDSDDEEGISDESNGDAQTVMITGNVPVEYTLTVDGTLRPDTKGGEFFGEEEDTPTQNSDGTWTASDGTGPHPTNTDGITYYGDRFFFSGSITELDVIPYNSSYDVNFYVDEQEVYIDEAIDFAESAETHTFMLTANGPTQYTLSVDGSLEPDTKGGDFSAEKEDAPTQNSNGTWTASDGTGPHPSNVDGKTYYGDRFFFTGSIVDVELSQPQESGDVNLYLNEGNVTRDELIETST